MPNADAKILVSQGTDKALDYESLLVAGQTVFRQRARVAGTAAAAFSEVLAADPASNEWGQVVRLLGALTDDQPDLYAYPTVKVGGTAWMAVPTAVSADGDRRAAWLTRYGHQVGANVPLYGQVFVPGDGMKSPQGQVVSLLATTGASLIAGVASNFIYVIGISVSTSGATLFRITRTTGGAVQWNQEIAANSASNVFPPPPLYLAKSTIGDGLSFTCTSTNLDATVCYLVTTANF